jgi:hypothetical protein
MPREYGLQIEKIKIIRIVMSVIQTTDIRHFFQNKGFLILFIQSIKQQV